MPYPWLFETLIEGYNYVLPSGTYYIGDIFPALKTNIYDESFNETGLKSGVYKCSDGIIILGDVAESNGYEGTYLGSDEFEYIINSGSIGIVSTDLIKEESYEGGQVYHFPDGLNVIIDSGYFTFETEEYVLHIDTNMYGPEDGSSEDKSDVEGLCCALDHVNVCEMDVD